MAKIFTTCAVTGRSIDTGIEIDEGSFGRLPKFTAKVFCPHCSSDHEWSSEQAWMRDEGEPQA